MDSIHLRQSIWFSAFALILSVTAFSMSQGLTYPLLSILLQKNGESASLIGLNAAMTPLGILFSAPIISRFGCSINRVHAIVGAILLIIINLILIGIFQDLRLWFFLRFILGGVINVVYVLSETTLIEISPQKYRGRLLGAYTSISTLGYAAGPTVLAVIGSEGLTPFIITSFILSISVIPIIFAPIHIHQPLDFGACICIYYIV